MRRYYDILELSEDATPDQIEKAYKRAASKHHPDKNIGNEAAAAERFKDVKEAYECLSDPERKRIYDETGDTSIETGNPAEDLLIHLLNEVVDHFETATEVISKVKSVIEQMIDECGDRKLETDRRILVTKNMLRALRFKGKGANFIEGVMSDKLARLEKDRTELDEATTAAKAVWDMLKDYDATDRPAPMSRAEQEAMASQMKVLGSMLHGTFGGGSNRSGKRRGGMPFSGV